MRRLADIHDDLLTEINAMHQLWLDDPTLATDPDFQAQHDRLQTAIRGYQQLVADIAANN